MSGPRHHWTNATAIDAKNTIRTTSNMESPWREKKNGEAPPRPAGRPRRRGSRRGLSGRGVSYRRALEVRFDSDTAVVVVQRINAMRAATPRILAGGQRREMPI